MIRDFLKTILIFLSGLALTVSEVFARTAKRLVAKDLSKHNNDGAMK